MALDSHLIQSNAYESNASANADKSNAAFALAFANPSAFEHKPGLFFDTTVEPQPKLAHVFG